MNKTVTLTFTVEVKGELVQDEQRMKELVCDLLVQAEHDNGTEAFDWAITSDDEAGGA